MGAASKIVSEFLESLSKKVFMDPRDAASTYGSKAKKIAEEDPRFFNIYDEEDIGGAIYNSRTLNTNLGVTTPEKFLDMAAQMPLDQEGFDFIRKTVDQKKADIAAGVPREQFTFPQLGLRLQDDGSLKVNLHDGRHLNTAMKELGYPKSLVEVVPQYRTPNIKTMSPDTPVFSEESFINDVEIPSRKVGTLGDLIKFLSVAGIAAPGALSTIGGQNGTQVQTPAQN
tara:strand:+ start:13614 stop:14294 length:681 start_codon:yes stop_codon:yes gene_type:complete